MRAQPARMIATCILAGSEKPTSSFSLVTPLTSSLASSPGRTSERWMTRPCVIATNFSESTSTSPGSKTGVT